MCVPWSFQFEEEVWPGAMEVVTWRPSAWHKHDSSLNPLRLRPTFGKKRSHGYLLRVKLLRDCTIVELRDDPMETPDYCLLGSCRVLMANGSYKTAAHLQVGDCVMSVTSQNKYCSAQVEARVVSVLNRQVAIATSSFFLLSLCMY